MHSALVILVSFVTTGWFVISALRYVPPVERWVLRKDAFYLVPQWNFFAPTPNEKDFYLFYRTASGPIVGPWRELSVAPKRPATALVWNPHRRNNKALLDLCQGLVFRAGDPREAVLLSLPYLLLLNFAASECKRRQTVGDRVQFAIGAVTPAERPHVVDVVFSSDFHRL